MTALWGSWASQTLVAKGQAWSTGLGGSWKLWPAEPTAATSLARDLVREHVSPIVDFLVLVGTQDGEGVEEGQTFRPLRPTSPGRIVRAPSGPGDNEERNIPGNRGPQRPLPLRRRLR